MYFVENKCCALGQLVELSNRTTYRQLSRAVELLRAAADESRETKEEVTVSPPRSFCSHDVTTILAATAPGEDNLAAVLRKCGFRKLEEIRRRPSVGEGNITLWILDL